MADPLDRRGFRLLSNGMAMHGGADAFIRTFTDFGLEVFSEWGEGGHWCYAFADPLTRMDVTHTVRLPKYLPVRMQLNLLAVELLLRGYTDGDDA